VTAAEAFHTCRDWTDAHAARTVGFRGALLHGSICYLSENEVIPSWSDVDLIVVCDESASFRAGKTICGGLILDVSTLRPSGLTSADGVLSTHWLAGSVARGLIAGDRDGFLQSLCGEVASRFFDREWIHARCEYALRRSAQALNALDESTTGHDASLAVLFGLGLQVHAVLAAACVNPTVRGRYESARAVLDFHGMGAVQEELLRLLGSAALHQNQVADHLTSLSRVYARAAKVPDPPPHYANHVSASSRAAAIEGTRRSIDLGTHREAMFWISACYAKSVGIIMKDQGSDILGDDVSGFAEVLRDLALDTVNRRHARREQALRFVAVVRDVSRRIARHSIRYSDLPRWGATRREP
jgi:hypothetical protein